VGDGPLAHQVRAAASRDERIEWLGHVAPNRILDLLADAACLVIPSIWYEGLPRTIVESFAVGTPVIASRIGAMINLVYSGASGFHFESGNPSDLNRVIDEFFSDPSGQARFRRSARETFEREFSAPVAYQKLMNVYESALASPVRAARREKFADQKVNFGLARESGSFNSEFGSNVNAESCNR
jgi:glycosyltransferase involved in cell wall biosynthesis